MSAVALDFPSRAAAALEAAALHVNENAILHTPDGLFSDSGDLDEEIAGNKWRKLNEESETNLARNPKHEEPAHPHQKDKKR